MNAKTRNLTSWKRLENGRYEIHNVPLFHEHTRWDEVYDAARLQEIAKNSGESPRNPLGPKVFIEHWGERRGNLGRIDPASIRVVGETIFGTLTNLRPQLFQEIAKDAWPQWSVEIDIFKNRIDGVAFLGADESYFPFPSLAFEIDDAQAEQLRTDCENDKTYTYSKDGDHDVVVYADGVELIERALIPYAKMTEAELKSARESQRGSEMNKVYDKDGNEIAIRAGVKLVKSDGKYELTPEDASSIIEIVQGQLEPVLEVVQAIKIKVDQIDAVEANKEELDNPDAEGADEDKPDTSMEETDDKDVSEDGEEGKKEHADDEEDKDKHGADEGEEEDDKEDNGKRSIESDVEYARLKAENAKLKYAQETSEVRGKLEAAIDRKIYGNETENLVEDSLKRVMGYSGKERTSALESIIATYKRTGVPSEDLPKREKDGDGQGGKSELEKRAAAYAKKVKADHERVGAKSQIAKLSTEELTKFYMNNPHEIRD